MEKKFLNLVLIGIILFSIVSVIIISIANDNASCSEDIGKKVELDLGFVAPKLDMDWYIPFFKIDVNKMSCKSLNFWKWIFKYESNGYGYYLFVGLKVWIIISITFIYFIYLFIRSMNKEKKKLNRILSKHD